MFYLWLFGESLYLNNCPFWYEAIEFVHLNSLVNISKTSKAAKTISYIFTNSKSSRPELFCKKDILWNFAKFTGNDLCQSLFFRPATLLKKSLWHRCFPMNFTKFLRIPFFTEHLRWLLRKFLYWATCFFLISIWIFEIRLGYD